jgi:hypothetical protein
VANMFIKRITGLPLHDFGTTFRAYNRELIKDINLLGEFHRLVPALGVLEGGRICEIPIKNIQRPAGKNSYGLSRTIGVMIDLILLHFFMKYTDRPMRLFGKWGLICAVLGTAILSWLIGYALAYNVHAVVAHQGWFMMSILLLLFSGQLFMIGFVAEMISRLHFGNKNTRVYRVRHIWDQSTEEPVQCVE